MVFDVLSIGDVKGDVWQSGGIRQSLMPAELQKNDSKHSKFDSILDSKTTLLLASSENYNKSMADLFRILMRDNNLPGIYVTVSRSCKDVSADISTLGIPSNKLLVMDMISESTGTSTSGNMACTYLHSPQSLTDLSIAITEAVTAMDTTEMFVVIDSLSTLLLYNPPSIVMQFANFITNKMRSWGIKGVLVGLSKEMDEKTTAMLKQFVDNTIIIDE